MIEEFLPKWIRSWWVTQDGARSRIRVAGVLSLSGALLSGCVSTAQMAVPPALVNAPAWPVSGRQGWTINQELSFGPYRVHSIRRSWTRGSDLKLDRYEQSRRRQTFRFTLAAHGRDLLEGEFQSSLRRRAVEVAVDVELQNRSELVGQLRVLGEGSPATWTVQLWEDRETPLAGSVGSGAQVLRVLGTTRLEGSPLPLDATSGYTLALGDRELAAVEVVGNGTVRFAEGGDPAWHPVLAGTAAALLLAEELRNTLPE